MREQELLPVWNQMRKPALTESLEIEMVALQHQNAKGSLQDLLKMQTCSRASDEF